jgi:probable rRNA maturation factor
MKVSLDISVASSLWRGLPKARALARETIAACVAESGTAAHEGAEVSLCLADDAALRALNLRWRGIDKPTNVLSFPFVDAVHSPSIDGRPYGRPMDRVSHDQRSRLQPPLQLGDIALAYETLAREAGELGVPLADHYRHLVAHGFLHLIGYDHETDEEAERMEALETRILARLGAADPYAREVVEE